MSYRQDVSELTAAMSNQEVYIGTFIGNYDKARKILKWKPKHDIKSLIKDMIDYEISHIKDDFKKF